jgi:hypothetical protein
MQLSYCNRPAILTVPAELLVHRKEVPFAEFSNCETMLPPVDFFFYALIWSALAILVGQYARHRRRDQRNWAALAFLISAPLAFLILTAMERASRSAAALTVPRE